MIVSRTGGQGTAVGLEEKGRVFSFGGQGKVSGFGGQSTILHLEGQGSD